MARKRFWGIPEISNSAAASTARLDQARTAGPVPQRVMAAVVASDGAAWAATTSSISAWVGAPGAAGRSSSADARSQVRPPAGAAVGEAAGDAPGEAAGEAAGEEAVSWYWAWRVPTGRSAAPARLDPISVRRENRGDGKGGVGIVVPPQ